MKQIARHCSEAELAAIVVTFLESQGWTTYKEVRGGDVGSRIADIVALKDGLIWVVEAKLAFSAVVVEQAWKWKRDAHFISIAVPQRNLSMKGSSVLHHFCNAEGIGILGVRPSNGLRPGTVETEQEPLHRQSNAEKSKLVKNLLPQQQDSQAGTKGNIITPYRVTVNGIADFLAANGPSTLKEIIAAIPHHYRTKTSARASLLKNLVKFESDQFEEIKLDGEVGFKLKQ
jgi:hypothetical protein